MEAAPEHPDHTLWKERAREWYPSLLKETFFVPAVFMNRTKHSELQFAGHTIFVTSALHDESIVRDDTANNKVLSCLQKLPGQQMFVISQLDFSVYLSKPVFKDAASLLPRLQDPFLRSQKKDRGDFDVLILHRYFGILACEIKAVGDDLSKNEPQNERIVRRIKEAIKQLNKSREALKYLVSKDPIKPFIGTALMLPNVSATQLRSIVDSKAHKQLKRNLCQCLCVPNGVDPVPLCLTSDDLQTPDGWWKHVMTKEGNSQMTNDAYLTLISRFAGPATTVTVQCPSDPRLASAPDVRTVGEAVMATANRFVPVHIVLHPQQLSILKTPLDLVYIAGPPGAGKSLVLFLKGLDWLRQYEPVHVVSSNKKGLAATHMIAHQLKETSQPEFRKRIFVHNMDLAKDPVNAATTLTKLVQDGKLFLLMDEIVADSKSDYSSAFSTFFEKLRQGVKKLHLWSASLYHNVELPDSLQKSTVTCPLRTPPSVTREVGQCHDMRDDKTVFRYNDPLHHPCEGPKTLYANHSGRKSPTDCYQCGMNVGKLLLQILNVGGTRRTEESPEPLRYSDIFVLTSGSTYLYMTKRYNGSESQSDGKLVKGLMTAGIPVTVLKSGDAKGIEEVACMSGPNRVVAAHCDDVKGLERKVVVFVLPHEKEYEDECGGRLHAVSRCVSQLIWVKHTPGGQCSISRLHDDDASICHEENNSDENTTSDNEDVAMESYVDHDMVMDIDEGGDGKYEHEFVQRVRRQKSKIRRESLPYKNVKK